MGSRFWHALKVAALGLAFGSSVALATPQVGWWWNPAESGRGFFVESQGGVFYMAGYFYDVDGRPTWLVAGGPNADPYSFNGQLQGYSGGQTLFGAYKAPTGPADGGAVSVRFTDDTHGTITWPGGTIAIQRHVFGGTAPAFRPSSGWWWNPAESGRGFSIELQGDTLFVASFMYDDAGKPVWYLSAGAMTSPTHYEGPWRRYANGQTMTGSYHPPDAPQTIGTLAIDFAQADKATMTVTPTAAAVSQSANATAEAIAPLVWPIEREFRPEYVLDPQYDIRFTYSTELHTPGIDVSYKVRGLVQFEDAGETQPLTPSKLVGSTRYLAVLDPNEKPISIDYTSTTASGFICSAIGSKTAAIPPAGRFELEVSKYGAFVGTIVIPKISFSIDGTCTAPGSITFPLHDVDDGLVVIIPIAGTLEQPTGHGSNPLGVGNTHSWTWAFVPVTTTPTP